VSVFVCACVCTSCAAGMQIHHLPSNEQSTQEHAGNVRILQMSIDATLVNRNIHMNGLKMT
jgi:hypothetical protein